MGISITNLFEKFEKKYQVDKYFRIFILIIFIIIFCFVYIQGPLFRSNQHTKFLHGLAKAGYGYLKYDWLANTIDPLPVFSFLVYITMKFLHQYMFYLYFVIIIGVYIFSIIKILSNIFDFNNSLYKNIIYFTVISLLHSTILFDTISYKLFHYRLIELFVEEGVAGQYLIGRSFQPCVFGVFLILSIYLFIKNKPFWAVFFLGIASTFHIAYLFSSGVLTLSYMIILYKEERKLLKPFLIGLISLMLILPVTFYYLTALKATTPELSKRAMDILVKIRIPHHSDPKIWLNTSAYIKAIIIGLALFIIRKKRLFLIILVPFILAILFTIIEFFIENDFIGFLAPWRVSVWLVPISTCIILGYLLSIILNKFSNMKKNLKTIILTTSIFILLVFFIAGVDLVIKNFNLYLNKDHGPMMNFVSKNKSKNDVYLIPDKLLDFRLNTGVPILVSYKTHPYKDVELIEWYKRLNDSKLFYNKKDLNKCEILERFKKDYHITHVLIINKEFDMQLECLKKIYKDNEYGIYKIR